MDFIISLFQEFSWTDGVDLVVISFIVYRFLLILQGTRAAQILFGLGTLALVLAISLNYEFYTINWLLTKFFDYFFIVLIILFQEQFRSILAAIGEPKWFGIKKKLKIDLNIEEIIHACMRLKKKKIGAIIVMERNYGLLNYSKTGTSLDCKIHSDLIFSLFQKESPLHDGACILLGNRIQAAGCFLPLSKKVDIDRQFGTRHRAALGLSELTDALVIVISEETGRIYLCHDGQFYHMEDELNLRRYMNKVMQNNTASDMGTTALA